MEDKWSESDPEFMASWIAGSEIVQVAQNTLEDAALLGWGLNERGIAKLRSLVVGESWIFTPAGMNPITVTRLKATVLN